MADTLTTLDRTEAISFDTAEAACSYGTAAGVPMNYSLCILEGRFYLRCNSVFIVS